MTPHGSPILTGIATGILIAAIIIGIVALGDALMPRARADTVDTTAAGNTIEPMAAPVSLSDGRNVVIAIYYIAALRTTFAGCLISLPSGNGYDIKRPFAHWYADDETDIVHVSQSLKGAIADNGGLAKFMLRFLEYGEECAIDASGFAASAQAPVAFTTRQLLAALAQWHLLPTQWPGLFRFWPSLTAPGGGI